MLQIEAALRQAATAEWLAVTVLEQSQPPADSLELMRLDLGASSSNPANSRLEARLPLRAQKPLAALLQGGSPSSAGPSLDGLSVGPPEGNDHLAWLLEQVCLRPPVVTLI